MSGQNEPSRHADNFNLHQSDHRRQNDIAFLKHAEEINNTLFEISNAVNTTLNLEDLYRSIHESLARIIDVTNFFIAIVDSQKRTLYFPYHVDTEDDDFSPISDFETESSLTGLVVVERRPVLLGEKELKDRQANGGIWGQVPVIWMGLPLIVKDTVIGVIALQSYTDPHVFNHQDLQVLTAVSHQIAIAIDRKQSQDELHRSEQRYRQLFDQSNDAIIIHRNGRIIDVNQSACRMLGLDIPHLLSLQIIAIQGNPDPDKSVHIEKMIAGHAVRFETEWKKSDGTLIPVEISSRIADVKTGIIQSIGRDITDRKKVENVLKESEERLRAILESSPDPIVVYDMQRQPQFITPAFTRVFGWSIEELRERRIPFVPEEQKEKTASAIRQLCDTLQPVRFETQRLTRKGDLRDIQISAGSIKDIDGRPAGVVMTLTDTTEKNRLTAQLHAAQKLESIGTLAGGIAHDFNNLLTGIIGHVSLMMDDLDPLTGGDIDHLKGIESYAKDAAALTRQLLGFARGGKFEIKPTHINDLLEKQSHMFGRTKKEIRIHSDYEKNIRSVEVDRGQIEQVIMNLYINAWQAMPGGGDLYVQTKTLTIDGGLSHARGVQAGDYIQISVSDTGVGIDEVTQGRIFDPFFTTKEMGRGTGLGLASVYGIIKNHGGFIDVSSQRGHGSTFTIYLPVSGKEVQHEKKPTLNLMQGTETILLVDDERMIIEVGEKILQKLGYNVLVARNGREAIDIYRESQDRIDLVILDMIMPEWDGGKTFDELISINPAVIVLLSSGYSVDGQAQSILDRGCIGFIQKPFSLNGLSEQIRKTLDRS